MEPIPPRLIEEIERRLRQRRVHGLAVVGFDVDGLRFGGGVGFADLNRGELVSPDTVFRVASVSKQLTTATVLKAVGDGLLDLDQPVHERLPEAQRIVDADGEPTDAPLRSFLSHSSGLPASVRGADLGNPVLTRIANGTAPTSLADAITGLRVERGAGQRIVYANSGLNVAGFLAGLAFGTSFEDAARQHVLEPLGMVRSAFSTRRQGPGTATPYGSIVPPGISSKPATAMQLVATPMGGLTTTARELSHFGRMVLGGGVLEGDRILPEGLVAAATTMEITNHPDLEQGYGLGFKVRRWRDRTLVGHDGNMPGVSAQVWLSPSDGVGVAVLTNGIALGIPHEVALLAIDEILGPDAVAAGTLRPADNKIVTARTSSCATSGRAPPRCRNGRRSPARPRAATRWTGSPPPASSAPWPGSPPRWSWSTRPGACCGSRATPVPTAPCGSAPKADPAATGWRRTWTTPPTPSSTTAPTAPTSGSATPPSSAPPDERRKRPGRSAREGRGAAHGDRGRGRAR